MNRDKVLPRLQVSQNRRFLITENGSPFFWLGDTAWELFHRLTREEAEDYLVNREANGFNMVQAVILAEFDGLNTANAYGDRPLDENDPTRPNEAYFAHVDAVIDSAEQHHLYIGLLPTWGDKVNPLWGIGPLVFNPENAYVYGKWLGERYRDRTHLVWIIGGDRPPFFQEQDQRPIWRAMARGIREGVAAPLVMTYHPSGGHSTSEWLHDEAWLDVNMMQSGHGSGHDVPVWEMVEQDYQRQPTKPTLDGEPNYEDHPVNPWPTWDPANGYFRDHDVRKQLYRSVFAGACGVTYGHHSIWQFYEEKREPVNYPDMDWRTALNRPAARQVRYLRALMEQYADLERIPDQGLIVGDSGEGGEHVQATRSAEGRYALVYLPTSRSVTVHMDRISGKTVLARWYDPQTGHWQPGGHYPTADDVTFTPPTGGLDWVLVMDGTSETRQENAG